LRRLTVHEGENEDEDEDRNQTRLRKSKRKRKRKIGAVHGRNVGAWDVKVPRRF
jgi:hypothetical protein